MVKNKTRNLNLTTACKKISSLVFSFCILQCSMCFVESATNAAISKSGYARIGDEGRGVSSSLLDSIYQKSRQSRCVTCYENRRYGDDRYAARSDYATRSGDDLASSWYYSNNDRYDDRSYRGAEYDRYGASEADRYGAARYGADRYSADRYGTDRYGADRYGADRYGTTDRYVGYRDDHYGARPSYDRYDTRTRGPYERPAAYDRGESRGYGYDNRNRYYGSDRGSSDYYGGDRYYDRPRYDAAGSTAKYGGYDRYNYDRYSPRYDMRHYRQWDNSYRGKSEYEDTGHGSYYPKYNQEDLSYLPEPIYNSPASSPCGVRKPNCPYSPQEEGTRVTSGTIDSAHYNMGVSQTTYNKNSNTNHNESSKGLGTPGGWSYLREDEQSPKGGSNSGSYSGNNNNSRDRNSNQQSSGYGALLDRGSNLIAVEPAKSDGNANDSMTSNDMQKDKNGDESPTQSDN